eukprot:9467824-Pyramimonas_sp.AAC.1
MVWAAMGRTAPSSPERPEPFGPLGCRMGCRGWAVSDWETRDPPMSSRCEPTGFRFGFRGLAF